MRKALALSFAAHGMLVGAFVPLAHRPAPPPLAPAEDQWTGTTAELPGIGGGSGPLVDVSVDDQPAQPGTPPAELTPPAAKEPIIEKAPPAAKEPVIEKAPPVAKEPAIEKAPPVAKEPAIEKPRPKPRAERPKVEPPADASQEAEPDRPAKPPSQKRPRGTAASADQGGSPGGGATGPFGAEGPASVRDLGRAFTRAIPSACSADPVWGTLSTGDAGKLEVTIRVDGEGHIKSAEPRGTVQPKALVNVVRRTIPLLEAGTFALRAGATAEGTEILELGATVSDGSDEWELANEYDRGKGKGRARLNHASGRHVEISVRVVRVDVAR